MAETRQIWFGRLVDAGKAPMLTGRFEPFPELARHTLRSVWPSTTTIREEATDLVDEAAQLSPYAEARPALELLSASRLRVVVLRNGGREHTRQMLERAGLAQLIDHVFTTDDAQAYKPDPRTYLHVCRELDLEPRQGAWRWFHLGAGEPVATEPRTFHRWSEQGGATSRSPARLPQTPGLTLVDGVSLRLRCSPRA